MKIFFDAYRAYTTPLFVGQPVSYAPILSTNDLGEVVIDFSTGGQEDLASTTDTFLYSLTEHATDALTTSVTPVINWFYRFEGGERITGPLTLYDNGLYFSTYAPPTTSADACSTGTSRVFGMHYANIDETATKKQSVTGDDLSRGGSPMLPKDGDPDASSKEQYYDQTDKLFDQGSIIFGVGVAQIPSCFETGAVSTDPFFGSSYQPTTTASTSHSELVMQTGSEGTTAKGATTKTVSIPLAPPDKSPRIDSWALVMD